MIYLFFKIYNYIYILFLKFIYKKQLKIYGKIKVKGLLKLELSSSSTIVILGNLVLQDNVTISVRKGASLTIGKDCFFNKNCSIVSRDNITIEDDCMFGENIKIYDHNHLIQDGIIYKDKYDTKSITIGKNCWIANDVNILKGSIIPKNTVIGAMSLVNKELKESAIYTGIPVKLQKKI